MALIYSNPYKDALEAAKTELVMRHRELQAAQARIGVLEAMISVMEPLAQNDFPPPTASLTSLCQEALDNARGQKLTPIEIRHKLELMGIQIQGQNPMAILHTALGRLAADPHSNVSCEAVEGNTVYFWTGKPGAWLMERLKAEVDRQSAIKRRRKYYGESE